MSELPAADPLRTAIIRGPGAVMVTTFECLGCGRESILEKLPAKCPTCGHGNGLLRDNAEPVPAAPPEPPRENPPTE
jgi:hypothetical protein